ncbi:MAG: methyltransferase domain-containing protein [Calditrichia bacterium]|nr:methyltransferase domain-containing protein [Calditrichia bacterium]
MIDYLQNNFNLDDDNLVSTIDELTLWSAPFGLMLLDHIKLSRGMKVLDVGCGLGFPALELAQRLGESCMVYGIDPWGSALNRAKQKINNYNIKNVKLIEGDASATEFEVNYFDLIVSNLGINNFEKPKEVLKECYRILKPNGQIALTTNFKGHMQEFYDTFKETLLELKMNHCLESLQSNIDHRLDLEIVVSLLKDSGFKISKTLTDSFNMRFLDGSALLRHYFIRLGFLDGWKNVIPKSQLNTFFKRLEGNLNGYAKENGELKLTIPLGYIEGIKT